MHDTQTARAGSRPIGLFALTMLAIVSVDSLRNISIAAQYGPSLLVFYGFAALAFFFPLAVVTSKLASEYPVTGGSFVWIEKAFGKRTGYASIWLQWIYNMVWYPTIFVFISSIGVSLIQPELEHNKALILTISLGLFWLLTFAHTFGLAATRWLGSVGALIGTLVPMTIIIALGTYWLVSEHPSATPLHLSTFLPDAHSLNNIGYFSNILFSLLGLEVIAMHAGNVQSPKRSYPRALLISAVLIPLTLALSAFSLCIILPENKISLVSGTMDVFRLFFNTLHWPFAIPLAGICVIAGGLATASSWMLGLARGLHTALRTTANTPAWALKQNANGIPTRILLFQALIYSFLLSAFLLFGNINASYWMLSALTAQFALLYYIIFFMAALKLYRIKSGALPGFWVTVPPVLASLTCLCGLIIGFLPPEEIPSDKALQYKLFLLAGMVLMVFLPGILLRRRGNRG